MRAIILIIFTFSVFTTAAGEKLIEQQAFFQDPSNLITIDQIQKQNFIAYDGLLNKGYSNSAYWVRLKVNRIGLNGHQVLRILPTFLDDIEVYQKLDGEWSRKVTGDQHAFNDREYQNTSFGVKISPDIEDIYLYIRLKTTSTNMLSFELVDEKTFYGLEGRRDFAIGSYFGTALIIFIFVLLFYLKKTRYLLNEFGFFLLIEIGFILSLLGYTSRFIFPDKPNAANFVTSLAVVLFVFAGALFHRNFVKNEVPIKWIVSVLNACLLVSSILVLCIFFVDSVLTILKINQIIALTLALLFGCIAGTYFFNKAVSKYVAIGYGLLSLSIMSGILPNLGVIKAIDYTLYATSYTGLLSSLLISSLLIQRQNVKELAAVQMVNQLNLAKQEALFEKDLRERQNKFLTMLAHEMRTPLSVLKLTVTNFTGNRLSQHAERAVDDMNQIIERCMQLEKIENAKELLIKTDFDPIQIVGEIINQHVDSARLNLSILNNIQTIYSDKTFFNIIISNLIENAVKYSPAKTIITISIDNLRLDEKNYWRFSITNQVGKAGQPDKEMLFDKFYRNPKARKISGSGLGLFLVKSLTNTLNGQINYIPINKTVKFELCLPL